MNHEKVFGDGNNYEKLTGMTQNYSKAKVGHIFWPTYLYLFVHHTAIHFTNVKTV
jgi:hypothetical protein